MANVLAQEYFTEKGRVSKESGHALIDRIWGSYLARNHSRNRSIESQPAKSYLRLYTSLSAVIDSSLFEPKTHEDAVEAVEFVRSRKGKTLQTIKREIAESKPTWLLRGSEGEDAAQAVIDFVLPLWIMMPATLWRFDQTLASYTQSKFNEHRALVAPRERVTFNARMLRNIGGVNIIWTSQLNDHLLLNPDTAELFVFQHASFCCSRKAKELYDIFPNGLLTETAETLSILYPLVESTGTRSRWQRKQRRKADLDVETGIACSTTRSFDHFYYWHDRLVILQRFYDQSSPKQLRQWIYDRRDANTTWTFWLAVMAICLTLIFGLIQSVTGIMQVIRE